MRRTFENGVSVIVCCYNSAKQLPQTLKHLAQQQATIDWEIIIVMNNCTDDTEETAKFYAQKYGLTNLILINAEIPGLTNARSKGVKEAKYNIVVFCDDDNWLAPEYIQVAIEIMNNNNRIGILGGESSAVNENILPKWWDAYKHGYAVGKQASASGKLETDGFIWGAGMISRKDILQKVFDERFPSLLADRTGIALSSGGDVEICRRVQLLGFELHYNENLVLQHNITSERLSENYRDRLFEGHSIGASIIMVYDRVIQFSSFSFAETCYKVLRELIKILLKPLKKSQNNEDSCNRIASMLSIHGIAKDHQYQSIIKFKNHFRGKNFKSR